MFKPNSSTNQFITLSTHVSPSIVKTTGGDYLVTWFLAGLPFVGRDEWELEHKHKTFNRLLQTLRAPDYVNISFWVHDVRRKGEIKLKSHFSEKFNQQVNNQYFEILSDQKIMNNELFLTMIYRPVVSNKTFTEKVSDLDILDFQQRQAIDKLNELSSNLEAVLKDYAPYRLSMYEAENGIVFSETLEFFGYLINRISEPVPVLDAPIYNYLSVSKHTFSTKNGDFYITTPDEKHKFGSILNIKDLVLILLMLHLI